ncbi:MAG: caspase family protein [Hyphomicrobiaceae bacterium]
MNFIYSISLAFGVFAQTTAIVAAPDQRVALVIGNASYAYAGDLVNPKNDADDVARAFEKVGFRVIKGTDLDKRSMDLIIRRFARVLRRAKVGAFFYAGHGIQVDGKNYLVPVDAKLEDATGIDFELLRVDVIQRTMERVATSNLIFLDACRNNPLARNLARAMGTRAASIGQGLASVESGVGTLISFSTQPGNLASDGTGRNSPYAAALAKFIDRPGDNISDILINVRRDVMRATNNRQIPWEHTALTDKIVFVPKAPGPASSQHTKLQRDSIGDRYYRQTLKEMQHLRKELQKLKRKRSGQDKTVTKLRPAAPPPETSAATAQDDKRNRIKNESLTNLQHPFDGIWQVAVKSIRDCPNSRWRFSIIIAASQVSGGRRMRGGTVGPDGTVTFEHAGKRNPSTILRYVGKITHDSGKASVQAVGKDCYGVAAMEKLAANYARSGTGKLANLRHAFDGIWEVTVTSAKACRRKSWKFNITIAKSRVSGGRRMRGGKVDRAGKLKFEFTGRRNPSAIIRYTGEITPAAGKARFRNLGRKCRGAAAMRKIAG